MCVLVYIGPSLDLETAKSIVPAAIFKPPISHADLISDIATHDPTHVLIIDGTFQESLPVWHKEISMAALSGIRVYGASSMGALRASELADFGVMIGCGRIFRWYHEGVIDADDEVALNYHVTPKGQYISDSVPLVNYRMGLLEAVEQGVITQGEADSKLLSEKSKHYSMRTCGDYVRDQKREDAIELLSDFMDLDYCTDVRPTLEFLTPLFKGMLERERRANIRGTDITLQNIDSYISLHSPQHRQIRWDAINRALVLVLAEVLGVKVRDQEIDAEWTSFCVRHLLPTWESFQSWLKANAMTKAEFDLMTIQNARIRKLQGAHVTSSMFSRETRTILDYLRSHNQLSLYMDDCLDTERKLVDADNAESLAMDVTVEMSTLIADHCAATGLEMGPLDDFIRYTGIGSIHELRVCLERYALARKTPFQMD